jgi:uncharacterized protein YeaO (DUF488 family)
MGVIAVKRVYDPPSGTDGTRVLVDRLWPRGLTKEKAALDLWAKDLAPSPELRKAFNHRPERFAEFARHYLAELKVNPAVQAFRAELKRPKVTLLFGAHDHVHNHALVLADFLRGTVTAPAPKKKSSTAKKRAAAKRSASANAPETKSKPKPKPRPQARARSRARSR